jgi:hypothetical protein
MNVRFTSSARSADALCTLSSDSGTLPFSVTLYLPNQVAGAPTIDVGTSTTSATVNYYQADSEIMNIPSCQLTSGINDNCFLTPPPSSSSDVAVKWSTPGFQVKIGSFSSTSDQRSYWVNLGSIGIDPRKPYSSVDLNNLINYIHQRLISGLSSFLSLGSFFRLSVPW